MLRVHRNERFLHHTASCVLGSFSHVSHSSLSQSQHCHMGINSPVISVPFHPHSILIRRTVLASGWSSWRSSTLIHCHLLDPLCSPQFISQPHHDRLHRDPTPLCLEHTHTFRVESPVCDSCQVWHFYSKGIKTLGILHLPPQGDFTFRSFSFSSQILRCIFIKLMLAVEVNKLNVFDRTLSCFL